uniref:[histone H3]-lysine(4) N-trimethyltransferase n=1 Tax=Petromyzon marinus TaxID=7757 RepID=S4RWW6_PETMA
SGERRGSAPAASHPAGQQQWKGYKLLVDPALKKGHQKVYRYDGATFSLPNAGFPAVDRVRDPRHKRFWARTREIDLPVPKFKIDEHYVGQIPPKEVTFVKLNDNVKESFLVEMCKRFGDVEEVEIVYNPKNRKHLGLAKVVFTTVRGAKEAVKNLHNTSVMGSIIHAQLDIKGEQRKKYYDLIVSGQFTPQSVPTGSRPRLEMFPPPIPEPIQVSKLTVTTLPPLPKANDPRIRRTSVTSTAGPSPTKWSVPTVEFDYEKYTTRLQAGVESKLTRRTTNGTPVFSYPPLPLEPAGFNSRRHDGPYTDTYGVRQEPHYPPPPPPPPPPMHFMGPRATLPSAVRQAVSTGGRWLSTRLPTTASPLLASLPSLPRDPSASVHAAPGRAGVPSASARATRAGQLPLGQTQPPEPPPAEQESPAKREEAVVDEQQSSLDSRIAMLLREQRDKFSFLQATSDSDDDEESAKQQLYSDGSVAKLAVGVTQHQEEYLVTMQEPGDVMLASDITGITVEIGTPTNHMDVRGSNFLSAFLFPSRYLIDDDNDDCDGNIHLGQSGQQSGDDMEISDGEASPLAEHGGHGTGISLPLSSRGPAASMLPPLPIPSAMPGMPVPPLPGYVPQQPPPPPPGAAYSVHIPPLPPMPPPPHPVHVAGAVSAPLAQPSEFYGVMELISGALARLGAPPVPYAAQTQVVSRVLYALHGFPFQHYDGGSTARSAGNSGGPAAGESEFNFGSFRLPTFDPNSMDFEEPHRLTVEEVLSTLVLEMKNIMTRDIVRKMVEMVAFKTFDLWWDLRESKAKSEQPSLAQGQMRDEERPRPKEMLYDSLAKGGPFGVEGLGMAMGFRGLHMPSFKVKRKDPPEGDSMSDPKRMRPSTPAYDYEEESEQGKEAALPPIKRDKPPAKQRQKRARSLDLDSEGEEESSDKESEESSRDSDDDSNGNVFNPFFPKRTNELNDSHVNAHAVKRQRLFYRDVYKYVFSPSPAEEASSTASVKGSSEDGSSSEYESSSSSDEEVEEAADDGKDVFKVPTVNKASVVKVDAGVEEVEVGVKEGDTAAAVAVPKPAAEASKKTEEVPEETAPVDTAPDSPFQKTSHLSFNQLCLKIVSFSFSQVPAAPKSAGTPLTPPSAKTEESDSGPETPVKRKRGGTQRRSPSPPPPPPQPAEDADSDLPRTPGRDSHAALSDSDFSLQTVTSPASSTSTLLAPTTPGPKDVRQVDAAPASSPAFSVPPTAEPAAATAAASPQHQIPLDHAALVKSPPPEHGHARSRGRSRGHHHHHDGPRRHQTPSDPSESPYVYGVPGWESSKSSDGPPSTPGRGVGAVESEDERLWCKERLSANSLLELANWASPLHRDGRQAATTRDLDVLADVALTAMKPRVAGSDREAFEPTSEAEELMQLELEEEEEKEEEVSLVQQQLYVEHSYAKLPSPSECAARKAPSAPRGARGGDHRHRASHTARCCSCLTECIVMRASTSGVDSQETTRMYARRVCFSVLVVLIAGRARVSALRFLAEPGEVMVDVEPGEVRGRDREGRREREPGEDEEEDEDDDDDFEEKLALYKQRTELEEMAILYDIWSAGIDMEDVLYMKEIYSKLLTQEGGPDWLNETHWVWHCHILDFTSSKKKKKDDEESPREHLSGCARCEGFYKLSHKEKREVFAQGANAMNQQLQQQQGGSSAARAGSERRWEQRRLLASIGSIGGVLADSDVFKFNQLKFRKKKLRFTKSRIHEWGLFALEPIAAEEMVIEYVGQGIRQLVADMREKRYEVEGIGSSYLFRVDHDTIIDATKVGNLARFINHSCNPNCYAKVITVESQKRIVIYSKQAINVNEEITYDYKFPIEENKIPCLCGAEHCRGTLN